MKNVLVAMLLLVAGSSDAIAGAKSWHVGYVILPDGRKLEGKLSYNWKADMIQVQLPNGLTKVYSAGQADSFVFFDNSLQLLRKFNALDLPVATKRSRPAFLEELTTGSLTVYRRLRPVRQFIKIIRPSVFNNDNDLLKDPDNFDYLVIDSEGRVFDLTSFDQHLWPKMAAHQTRLANYLKGQAMDPSTTVARLIMISQFNFLDVATKATATSVTGE
ncbi:hypothetical protein [Fibrella aquatica]|uniref:hypothetical protein n=1 Tax=Fibrella aquatica TaxID=3242487 RepID=UPI003521C4FB